MTTTLELRLAELADKPIQSKNKPVSRWVVPVALVGFSALMAVMSKGFLEPDEITHFLKARDIWRDWRGITDIWGRLGANGLYGVAAPFGVTAARFVAVAITALVGWATVIMVRHFTAARVPRESWFVRHGTAFAWLLLFAQPCVALNCFTVMTEMLLACSWAWAVAILILLRNRPGRGVLLAGFVLGLGGLMRPEAWIAIAAWPIFVHVLLKRNAHPCCAGDEPAKRARANWLLWPASIFLAGLPTLIWFLLGVLAHPGATGGHDWLWVIHGWPWEVNSRYGQSGGTFAVAAIFSMAIWLWAPVIVGISSLWFKKPAQRDAASERRLKNDARLCLVAPLAGLYLMHGLLGSLGLFGSMSLPRYFIPVAPMAAVLAILGCAVVEQRVARTWAVLFRGAVITSALAVLAVLAFVFHWLPMRETAQMRRLDVVAEEIQKRVPKSQMPERLIIGHPYLILALDLPLSCPATNRVFSRRAMAEAPRGAMLITDAMMWSYEGRPKPGELAEWGYRMDEDVAAKVDAVTMKIEPWEIGLVRGKVRLWVKQEKAGETQAAGHLP